MIKLIPKNPYGEELANKGFAGLSDEELHEEYDELEAGLMGQKVAPKPESGHLTRRQIRSLESRSADQHKSSEGRYRLAKHKREDYSTLVSTLNPENAAQIALWGHYEDIEV